MLEWSALGPASAALLNGSIGRCTINSCPAAAAARACAHHSAAPPLEHLDKALEVAGCTVLLSESVTQVDKWS